MHRKEPLLFLILLSLLLIECSSQSDTCVNFSTCGECIQRPDCVWCINPTDGKANCRSLTTEDEWCKTDDKITAKATMEITKNAELSLHVNAEHIQFKPQNILLRAPKHQESTLDFKFARAENPLDLYFLMDASFTMKKYKEILASLGQKLVKAVEAQTKDFRIGFGSFVDKTVFPFDYPESQDPICENCKRGYSFTNHLSLTENTALFEEKVNAAEIASNLDQPEGGLEALMQAIVCTEHIGWRPQAKRLIVFSTDDIFHVAGDARLAGIMLPNDGLCHLTENKYTKDKEIDYPSVSHISYKAKLHNIHIIFAIATSENVFLSKDEKDYEDFVNRSYEELSRNVALSKYATLRENSDEIIELIVQTYREIAGSVKITHNLPSEIGHIEFMVKCPNSISNGFEKNDSCSELKIGEIVDFRVIIKPRQCSKRQFQIKAEGIHDGLTMDFEVICNCSCEENVDTTSTVKSCSNNGREVCGVCSCNDGYIGKHCECSSTDMSTDNSKCVEPQSNKTCGGNGFCHCGKCKCQLRYYGEYCLCEDHSCPKYNSALCGGEGHGECKCGKCVCIFGWTGNSCECPTFNDQCIAPYSGGTICSGKGECKCGKCICKDDYYGDYCQYCSGCEWCADLDPCVTAYTSNTTLLETNNLKINCSSVIIVPRDNSSSSSYDDKWSKCFLIGEKGCKTVYKYTFDEDVILVEIGETTCPFIASLQGILLSILLPILVGGIFAFLAWKVVVTYQDKREYANFLKKRDMEKWNTEVNPLYKSAQTEYQNPMFNKHT